MEKTISSQSAGLWRFDGLWLRVVLAGLVVAAGDWLFWQHEAFGSGIGAFAALIATVALIARPAILRNWTGRIAFGAALLFTAALLYDPSVIGWLAFGVSLGIAILSPRVAGFGDAWFWAQRIIWQTMTAPFLPLLDWAKVRRAAKKRGRGQRRLSVWAAIKTLALPVTGVGLFLILFSAANPVIEDWLSQIGVIDWIEWLHPIRWFIAGLWLLTAWNAMRPRFARRLIPGFDGMGDVAIPGVTPASVTLSLILFNMLFALQNAMDIAWLWGWAQLPQGITLAEYAHRGAYPLIVTALLAGLFVLVTLRPGSQTATAPLVRPLVTLWVMQNIILVASSMLRTWDYVEAYSLTILRIAALEWMVLVGLGLAFILTRLWLGKSGRWLVNVNAGAAALVLGAATIVDHGAIAAHWNVAHAREVDGTGAQLDLCYLSNLGGSALLPLVTLEAEPRITQDLRQRVSVVRMRVQQDVEWRITRNDWTFRDRARLSQARAILATRPAAQPVAPGARDCDGNLIPPLPAPPIASAPPALRESTLTPGAAR